MKQIFDDARAKLAALPKWIKLLMWGQAMLCGVMILCLSEIMAMQQDQFVALLNVAATLLQDTPDSVARSGVDHAIKIGFAERLWIYDLLAAIVGAAAVGFLLVSLTSFNVKKY